MPQSPCPAKSRLADSASPLGITQQRGKRVGKRERVAGRNEKAVTFMVNLVANASNGAADNRYPGCHRLEHHERRPIRQRRHDEHVQRRHQVAGVGAKTQEVNTGVEAETMRQELEMFPERAVTDNEEMRFGKKWGDARDGSQKHLHSFLGLKPSDAPHELALGPLTRKRRRWGSRRGIGPRDGRQYEREARFGH